MRLENPNRASQGGDVPGDTKNDPVNGIGPAMTVAKASYDPGYSLETTLNDAGTKVSTADLKAGFCSYGKAVGERD
jgi:hypothetical protein